MFDAICGSVKLCMMKVITLAKAETMARKNASYTERHKFFTPKKKLQQGSKESLMIATCKTTYIVRK